MKSVGKNGDVVPEGDEGSLLQPSGSAVSVTRHLG